MELFIENIKEEGEDLMKIFDRFPEFTIIYDENKPLKNSIPLYYQQMIIIKFFQWYILWFKIQQNY